MTLGGMQGIGEARAEVVAAQGSGGGLELWLFDGDEARVSIVPSGDPNDARLGHYFMHRQNNNGSWVNTLCKVKTAKYEDEGLECVPCGQGHKPQHRFGIWVYVHHIIHKKNKPERVPDGVELVEQTTKAGKTVWVEHVKNFRMFSQPFGRQDYIWNQLLDVYNEHGNLQKYQVRISRTGSGMRDTSYLIKEDAKSDGDAPSETDDFQKDELIGVVEFYESREVSKQETAPLISLDDAPDAMTMVPDVATGEVELDDELF